MNPIVLLRSPGLCRPEMTLGGGYSYDTINEGFFRGLAIRDEASDYGEHRNWRSSDEERLWVHYPFSYCFDAVDSVELVG